MNQPASEFNLDRLETEFLQAWSEKGESPDIRAFIKHLNDDQQRQALGVLIPIDVQQRFQSGEDINAEMYSRLGDSAVAIAAELFSVSTPETPMDDLETRFEPVPSSRPASTATGSVSGAANLITDRYRMISKIGQGGMGTVWLAQQEKPMRRRVAIKIIGKAMDSEEALSRFEAERQALAMMNHPSIAKVLDAGTTEDNRPFFAMELVKGIPITQYCNEHKLTIEKRLELMIPVCEAVQHAHQKGIIHRDLKPSNILVSFQEGTPIAKVIDFGLAKALEHSARLTDKTLVTEVGRVVGTLQYMSPEQAGSNELDVDTRTDVYSLGVVLYQLLTETIPLESNTITGKSLLQIVQLIRNLNIIPPSKKLMLEKSKLAVVAAHRQTSPNKLMRKLEGELDWITLKALQTDRLERYQTANGMAMDFKRFLNNEPIVARPPSKAYLLKKFVSNNRGLVYSIASIAALMAIAIAVSYSYYLHADGLAQDLKLETEKLNNKNQELLESQLQTEKERKRAENQLQGYLASFSEIDPLSGGDDAKSAGDILDDAVKAFFEDESMESQFRANSILAIAESYFGLSEYNKAIDACDKVDEILQGSDKSMALAALKLKGMAVAEQQKKLSPQNKDPEAALKIFKEVYRQQIKLLDQTSPEFVDARRVIGLGYRTAYTTYIKAGREPPQDYINNAIEHIRWAYENSDGYFRNLVRTNLADAYFRAGNLKKAAELGKQAIEIWKKLIPDQNKRNQRGMKTDLLATQHNYAKTLHALGQSDQAITMIKQVIREKENYFGSVSHEDRRASIRLLLKMLRDTKRFDEAQRVIQKTRDEIEMEKLQRNEKYDVVYQAILEDLDEFHRETSSGSLN